MACLNAVASGLDGWQCNRCTYLNHIAMNYCEQCDFNPAHHDEDIAKQLQSEFEQQNNSFPQIEGSQPSTDSINIDTKNDEDIAKQLQLEFDQKHTSYDQKNNEKRHSMKEELSINTEIKNQCFQELLGLGIDHNIALIASEIYPKSVDKALDHIQNIQNVTEIDTNIIEKDHICNKNKKHIVNNNKEQKEPDHIHQEIEQKSLDIQQNKAIKYKYDPLVIEEKQYEDDMKMALKMQQELAQGMAWFCSVCFMMNMDIKQYKCQFCETERPKPKLPDVLTVRDDVCMTITAILRGTEEYGVNCIVNLALAQNFVIRWLKLCKKRGIETAKPKICYHWTKSANFDSIKQKGLKVPDGWSIRHQTDVGYYGKGIYMSPDPKYAVGYGHGAKKCFIALSLPGEVYKCPYKLGCSLEKGYDSHVSNDRNAMEWIFFDPSQLLLTHMVTLEEIYHVKQILDQVILYLESKYNELEENGGINDIEENKESMSILETISNWWSSWKS